MAKVVRAFSIDPEVADRIDRIAQQEATWHKRPNKSRVVNLALRWYYTDTNIADIIADRDSLVEFHRRRANGLASQGGVKHHLAGLLRCLNPFRPRKRV